MIVRVTNRATPLMLVACTITVFWPAYRGIPDAVQLVVPVVVPEAWLLVRHVTDWRPSESLAVPEMVRLAAVVLDPFLGEVTTMVGTEPPELTTPGIIDPAEPLRFTLTTRATECDELSEAVIVIMLAPDASGMEAVHAPEDATIPRPDWPLLVCH